MKSLLKKSYPHLIAIGIFLLICAIYFVPQLKGYLIYQTDHENYIGMSKEILDYRDKFGDETLWTNATFGGMPTYQIAALNSNIINAVKNFILKLIPRPIGYVFFLMAGFYILLLCFDVKPWLAIIGSIAFGLASFNMLYLGAGHNAKVHALSFIPPLIGGIVYAYRKNLWTGSILVSIFTCLHLTANHVQITYYLMFLILAIVLVELYVFAKNKLLSQFLKISAILIISGIVGILPIISNLVITNEYGKHTTRGKSELTITSDNQKAEENEALDSEYIKRYNFGRGEIWSLVIPNAKGGKNGALGQNKDVMESIDPMYRQTLSQYPSYWGEQYGSGGAFYCGASIFLLFILGLFFIKDKIKWAFLAVSIFAILLSMKYGIVIDFFIEKFPMFNKFRDSKMILVLIQMAFPLLGILFLKSFLMHEVDRKKFIYVALSVSGLFLLFYLMPTAWFSFLNKQEVQYFDEQLAKIGNNPNYLQQFEDIKNEFINARVFIFKKDCLRSLFFILASSALLFLFMYRKIKENLLLIGLGALIIIDLWGVDKRYLNNEKRGSRYNYWVDSYEYNNPFQPSVADMEILNRELAENPGLNQLIESETVKLEDKKDLKKIALKLETMKIYFRELNFATNYKVISLQNPFSSGRESYFHKSLGGYHGAKLRRINEIIDFNISREMSQISYFTEKIPEPEKIQLLLKDYTPVLNMLNTKYIISDPNKSPIYNPYRFGNAWFVEKIDIVKNADEEILALKSITNKNVVIQEKFKDKISNRVIYDSLAIIELKQYRPNHLTYATKAQSDQVAVFSEIYYEDGWNAYIDGQKTDYVKANFLLRAMNISAGDHVVEFKFEPESYYKSRKVSVAGSGLIVVFISLALFLNWRRRGKDVTEA